jgi:hypothetical protein
MLDLYNHGDTDKAIIADYPGSTLKIYKCAFNNLPWPLWQLLVIKNKKLIYNPIAKCGSSSLRSVIVALSDVSPAMKRLPLDTYSTGLQLGDLPFDEAQEILHDRSYKKFAVIRNPFDRLVSAYLEKFVVNRMNLGNQFHTRPVIAHALGVSIPSQDNFSMSITFSQFIDYIVSHSPDQLDPHWCPQFLYLKNVVYKLFRLEDLEELYHDLGIHHEIQGEDLRHNVTRLDAEEVAQAYALTPEKMPHSNIATACFYDENIRQKVQSYFALDFTLVESLGRIRHVAVG